MKSNVVIIVVMIFLYLLINFCELPLPKLCIICKLHYPRSIDILIYKDTHLPSSSLYYNISWIFISSCIQISLTHVHN